MAELATIARPYAEALFKSPGGDARPLAEQVERARRRSPRDPQLRQFADNPKVESPRRCST